MNNNLKKYKAQFENSKLLSKNKIINILFYLESTDVDFTEQPNKFGKSLLNGIDIVTEFCTFSIGNRFVNSHLGLSIDIGKTSDLETLYYDNEKKTPTSYLTCIIGNDIISVDIYWLPSAFSNKVEYYPQEIEIKTNNHYLLISSIEVTNGNVESEFANELLIIEDLNIAKELGLGQFGERKNFKNLKELLQLEIKNDSRLSSKG